MTQLSIRPETPEDRPAVFSVNDCAFPTQLEAELVDRVRAEALLSLVATTKHDVVGHALFTRVRVEGPGPEWTAAALGPIAVQPEFQREGVGGDLIREGLDRCAALGESVVFVLGSPDYYSKFGFVPAAPLDLHYEEASFDPYFMVWAHGEDPIAERTGFVRYHEAFSGV